MKILFPFFYLRINNYNIPLLNVEQQICLLVQHRS